jgi:hypothetical protein
MTADVIDIEALASLVVTQLENRIDMYTAGTSQDAAGGVISLPTVSEGSDYSAAWIDHRFRFDRARAPSYIRQFPEMLDMEFPKGSLGDNLENAVKRAIHERLASVVRETVVDRYRGYTMDDLASAVGSALAAFERHLKDHLFAPHRVKPAKIEELLSTARDSGTAADLARLAYELAKLESELRSTPQDGKTGARKLKEAAQAIRLVAEGAITMQQVHPEPMRMRA